jgi:hypothetical protein
MDGLCWPRFDSTPLFAPILDAEGRFPRLFEAIANVVPFQQVSLDTGVAIVGRLVERFASADEERVRAPTRRPISCSA